MTVESDEPIVIHRHVHVPPALVVTDETCAREGLDKRAFHQLVRRFEIPHVRTRDGVTVLRDDLARAIREHGAVMPPAKTRSAPPEDDVEIAMRALGARRPRA